MIRYILFCSVLFTSCVTAQTTSDREIFGDLPPAPLNGQDRPDSKPAEENYQLVPDPGSAPVAIFSRNGSPFLGEFTGRTEVVIEDRCLSFKDNKLPDRVCLAIPDGLDLPKGNFSGVQTQLRAYSGLEGKSEHVYLATDGGKELAVGYHFELTDDPQKIEFANLPPLRQKEVTPDQESNFRAAPVLITTDDGEEALEYGKIQTVRYRGSTYRVFLHTSVRQADGGSCGNGGYILRIMYVRDSRA